MQRDTHYEYPLWRINEEVSKKYGRCSRLSVSKKFQIIGGKRQSYYLSRALWKMAKESGVDENKYDVVHRIGKFVRSFDIIIIRVRDFESGHTKYKNIAFVDRSI